LEGHGRHLRGLVDLKSIRPTKVVVDAGNGMGGHNVPKVFVGLPLTLVTKFCLRDGRPPSRNTRTPLDPAKPSSTLQARVRADGRRPSHLPSRRRRPLLVGREKGETRSPRPRSPPECSRTSMARTAARRDHQKLITPGPSRRRFAQGERRGTTVTHKRGIRLGRDGKAARSSTGEAPRTTTTS